jgi:hypothetical protein
MFCSDVAIFLEVIVELSVPEYPQLACRIRKQDKDPGRVGDPTLSKYEVSPSLANVREFVPIPSSDTKATLRGLVFVYKSRSIKTKYVKKRTMVEDVDRCSMWTVAGGPLTC